MTIGRKLVNWAALALVTAIILVFAIPSYRQGEASISGKTAEDFPLDPPASPPASPTCAARSSS